jgi:hypothetical protein
VPNENATGSSVSLLIVAQSGRIALPVGSVTPAASSSIVTRTMS